MLSQVIHDKEKEFYSTYESDMYTLYQYFTQVRLEIRVTETNVCNFVVWTPHETLILGVNGDKKFQDKLCTNLVKNMGRSHIARTCNTEFREKQQPTCSANRAIR